MGSGSGGGGTISAVNPLVTLRDSLNVNEDRQVMSVRNSTDDAQDMYLRIVSLDSFDGTAWKPSQRKIQDVPSTFPTPIGLSADVRRTEVTTSISAADWYEQDWLPMPYPATGVQIEGNWRYEPVGRTLVGDHGQNTSGARYTVTSLDVQPTAQQLAQAPKADPALVREFTQVPESLPAIVARTAQEVTAGSANAYEQAVKLQDYFSVSGGFRYDTQVQVGSGSNAIARFLRDKEGFCVHFSFAMASMARTLGIPGPGRGGLRAGHPAGGPHGVGGAARRARLAGTVLRGHRLDALRADPDPWFGARVHTVRGSGQHHPEPGRAVPGRVGDALRLRLGERDLHGDGAAAERRMRERVRGCRAGPGRGQQLVARPAGVDAGRTRRAGAPAAADAVAAADPGRTAGAHGRSNAGAAVHALSAWQELTDTAWDFGISPEESQTPRKAAARIVRLGLLDPPAADAVHRVADAVEQVLYAPSPRPAAGLAEDVRRVTEALNATVSRSTRVRATFVPRSTVRVVWALSARWAAFSERAQAARPILRKPWGQQS